MECPVARFSRLTPNAEALVSEEKSMTYRELHQHINGVCAALQKLNVGKKSRCAFLAKTNWQTALLFFALFRLHAIACPLSFRQTEAERQKAIAAIRATHYLSPENLFCSSSLEITDLLEDQLATFIHTSASTGSAKIAVHTLGNHYYSALGASPFLSLSANGRYLLSLPLFHVGGIAILFRCFYMGATLLLSQKPLSEAIRGHQATHLSLVPTQLIRLLREEPTDSLQCLLMGGAPLGSELCLEALQRGLPLVCSYGMTETSSLVTAAKASTVSVGKPLEFREMKLSSEQEILVRGKTLFAGYLTEEDQVEKPLDVEGWFATKDIGNLLPNGEWKILGRKDRMFISGGENIHPEEIERLLYGLPRVLEAYVTSIEDPEFGRRPIAFLQQEGKPYTLDEVREWLEDKIASFKRPIQLHPLQKRGSKTLF